MTNKKQNLASYLKDPLSWLVLLILIGFVIGAGRVDELGFKEGSVGISESGKVVRGISVVVVGLISFMYLVSTNTFKYLLYGTNKYLLIFFLLCVLSTVFSMIPFITLFKSFELLVMLLLLSITYASVDRYSVSVKFVVVLLFMYTLTVIGVYVQFAVFGAEGQRQLVGVTPLFGFMLTSRYPGMVGNALGYLGALVALFGLFIAGSKITYIYHKQRKLFGNVIFLLGIGVTFFSYTRSVMLFLYLSIFLFFIYQKKYLLNALMVIMLIVPLFIPQVQDKIVDHLKRGDTEENIESMSGRTEMWASVFDRSTIKIILGEGYATGSKFMEYEKTGRILAQSNVHNGFLEVVMSVGLLGGIVWLGIMLRISLQYYLFYKKSHNKLSVNEKNFHIFMMALLFLSLCRSLMNSTFVYLDYFYPVLMAFILYGDSLKYKLIALGDHKKTDVDNYEKPKNRETSSVLYKKDKLSVLRKN